MKLVKGIGISIVSKRPCEELAFVALENILTEAISTPNVRSLDFSVGDIQIDNNLFETPCPVMLFTTRNSESHNHPLPAMHLNVKSLPSPNANAIIFEHLTLSLRPLTIWQCSWDLGNHKMIHSQMNQITKHIVLPPKFDIACNEN